MNRPKKKRSWLERLVIVACLAVIAAAVAIIALRFTVGPQVWDMAFHFTGRAHARVVTSVTISVTVIGQVVEVPTGTKLTKEELLWLGDELKANYASTAVYPGVDGRMPIWKYECEIEWVNGKKRLRRATPLHGF